MWNIWKFWPKLLYFENQTFIIIYFLGDFGLSQLTSLQSIHCHVAGFYKPTIPQSPPSHLQDYSLLNMSATMPGKSFPTNFVPSFNPIEWCLKNGLHSGGTNPQPFSYEYSALTTRPWLLAIENQTFFEIKTHTKQLMIPLRIKCSL